MVPVSCRTSFVAETQGDIGKSTEGLAFKSGYGLAKFIVSESPQGWTKRASRPIALGGLVDAGGPAVREGWAFNVGNDQSFLQLPNLSVVGGPTVGGSTSIQEGLKGSVTLVI